MRRIPVMRAARWLVPHSEPTLSSIDGSSGPAGQVGPLGRWWAMAGQSGVYRLGSASRPRVRRSRLEVAALDTAPGCLRLHAKHMLCEWGFPGLSDTTELLVSELVTNAVRAPEKVAAPSWPGRPSLVRPCVEIRL